MSWNVIQPSFASGELAPSTFARVDLQKYHSGAALLRNFFVDYRSGVSSRMGTEFVTQTRYPNFATRVIPFQTSVLTPYILEFGEQYIRFSSFGNPVLEAPFNIYAATQSSPGTLNIPGNNFANGDWIYLSGISGMPQLNDRYFQIQVSGSTVILNDVNGNPVDTRGYSPYTFGGTAGRVYTITTPYHASALQLLKFSQIVNQMYLTHPFYPPQVLTFNGPTNWTLAPQVFGTTVGTPGTPTVTASTTGTTTYAYEVTAVDASGQESSPSPAGVVANAVNVGATAGTITITWPAVPNAYYYNVYKAELLTGTGSIPSGAAFGFIGYAYGTSILDSNIVPDFSRTPSIVQNPFANNNYPGCSCFFQQRLYYAGSIAFPATFWASQPGLYSNFNQHNPIQASDTIQGTLVSQQVNAIKSMVPMPGGLLMFTAKGIWQLSASGGGLAATSAVTPINAIATPQSYTGASDVPPVVINQDVLYVQAKQSFVRDLQYNIYANIYTGTDVSVMSNHLFFGHQITQWAYAEEPFKTVWCIREDGILLTLTYLKEQEMIAWAHSDTLGQFTSTASVTENQVDAVYFVVKRYIGGQWVQFIERMADRVFTYGAEDAWCVDAGIQSTLPEPNANITTISAVSGPAILMVDSPVFNASSVGQILRAGQGIMTVTNLINTQTVNVNISVPIKQALPTGVPVVIPQGSWSLTPPQTVFSGLDYLNGQTVSILADGNVVPPQVVTNGQIVLQQPATKVTAGLPFTVQFQTMPLDVGNESDTIQGKRKKIAALSVRLQDTRGIWFGHTFNALSPVKEFSQGQALGTPISLVTGDERFVMDPLWDVPGQICLQVTDPLPVTVLGVIPEIVVGDNK